MTSSRHSYDQVVGQKVRDLRLTYRVKQEELAARLGLDVATISRYERGERGMNVSVLLTIADLFQSPAASLLPENHQIVPSVPSHTMPQAQADVSSPEPGSTIEGRALQTLTTLLRERPDLLVSVMSYIERLEFERTEDAEANQRTSSISHS